MRKPKRMKKLILLTPLLAIIIGLTVFPAHGQLVFPSTFSVRPSQVINSTLTPSSSFSVNVNIQFDCVDFTSGSFSFKYQVNYTTSVLTATGVFSSDSHVHIISSINDAAGIVAVTGSTDNFLTIFCPVVFAITHTFSVDSIGSSPLHLQNAAFCQSLGSCTSPTTVDGFFSNGPAMPDFSISANPTSLTIKEETSGTSMINLTSLNGFTGKIQLSASVSPIVKNGLAASMSPVSVTLTANGQATSTLKVSAGGPTPRGTYTVTVTGVSGTLTHQVHVIVTVTTG